MEKETTTNTYAPGIMQQTGLTAIKNGQQDSDTSALVSVTGSKTSDKYAEEINSALDDYLADSFGGEEVENHGMKLDEKSAATSVVTMQQWKVPRMAHMPRRSSYNGGRHSANNEGPKNRTGMDRSDYMLQLQTGDHTMSDITGSSEVSIKSHFCCSLLGVITLSLTCLFVVCR